MLNEKMFQHNESSSAVQLRSAASGGTQKNENQQSDKPRGLLVRGFLPHWPDSSIGGGLVDDYRKYSRGVSVIVEGQGDARYAVVSFKQHEDAAKALEDSKDKRFFGTKVTVTTHPGFEIIENSENRSCDTDHNEYSQKATRTLFVGNLDKKTTKDMLRDLFSKYGYIIEIDIKNQRRALSYAFIQFDNIRSVVQAVHDMDDTFFNTYKLKLGFGKAVPSSCVWVDGVSDTVSEEFLTNQFLKFGVVMSTYIDRKTGRALIFFETSDHASAAISEMRGQCVLEKKLQVDFASSDCQNLFLDNMESTGQLRPGDRPVDRVNQGGCAPYGPQEFITQSSPLRGGPQKYFDGGHLDEAVFFDSYERRDRGDVSPSMSDRDRSLRGLDQPLLRPKKIIDEPGARRRSVELPSDVERQRKLSRNLGGYPPSAGSARGEFGAEFGPADSVVKHQLSPKYDERASGVGGSMDLSLVRRFSSSVAVAQVSSGSTTPGSKTSVNNSDQDSLGGRNSHGSDDVQTLEKQKQLLLNLLKQMEATTSHVQQSAQPDRLMSCHDPLDIVDPYEALNSPIEIPNDFIPTKRQSHSSDLDLWTSTSQKHDPAVTPPLGGKPKQLVSPPVSILKKQPKEDAPREIPVAYDTPPTAAAVSAVSTILPGVKRKADQAFDSEASASKSCSQTEVSGPARADEGAASSTDKDFDESRRSLLRRR